MCPSYLWSDSLLMRWLKRNLPLNATGSFILLGMKKRGFGTGKWNGFGGKVEENESFEQAAVRELYEESSVTCNQEDLLSMGYIVFKLEDSRRYMKVHVYQVWKFDGEPSESDEMRPRWFTEDAIPYDRMWLDDQV